MKRKMRVAGVVTYESASGKRLLVPHGECEIDEGNGNVVIHWKDQLGNICQYTLSDLEFAQYQHNNTLLSD